MNNDYEYDEAAVLQYINYIDNRFDLIMLTEYFYESVVLLRRIMNWSMQGLFCSEPSDSQGIFVH